MVKTVGEMMLEKFRNFIEFVHRLPDIQNINLKSIIGTDKTFGEVLSLLVNPNETQVIYFTEKLLIEKDPCELLNLIPTSVKDEDVARIEKYFQCFTELYKLAHQ